MGTQDKGIRSMFPGVVFPSEEKEIQEARDYIKRKVGDISKLQAAPSLSSEDINILSTNVYKPIIEKLPAVKSKEEKFNEHMEKEYGPKAMGQYMRKKEFANRKAGKAPYENFSSSEIIVAEDIKDKAKRRLQKLKEYGIEESSIKQPDYPKVSNQQILRNNINGKLTPAERRKNLYNKKYDLPKQYDVKKDKITVDPKHPDGFRLTNDEDLYRHYGDTPVRYIQEIMYKYDDAPA